MWFIDIYYYAWLIMYVSSLSFFATLLLVKLAHSLLRLRSPLHDSLDHRVSPLDHRVSPFDHRVSSLDHRISSLDHRVSSLDTRVSPFDHRVSPLDHRVSSFDHRVSSFDHRLVDLVFGVFLEVSHSTFVSGFCFVGMYIGFDLVRSLIKSSVDYGLSPFLLPKLKWLHPHSVTFMQKQGGLSLFCCNGMLVSFGFAPFFAYFWSLSLTFLVSANLPLSVRTLVYVFLADVALDYFLRHDSVGAFSWSNCRIFQAQFCVSLTSLSYSHRSCMIVSDLSEQKCTTLQFLLVFDPVC